MLMDNLDKMVNLTLINYLLNKNSKSKKELK